MNDDAIVPARRQQRINGGLAGVALAISLAAWSYAPARVPTHWGPNGQPDDFMAPFPGLFLLPGIMAVLALLLPALPRIDPRGANYAAFGRTYAWIQIGILGFLLATHVVAVSTALGWAINMNRVIIPLAGLLLVGLGNVMGKLRPNWFVGIRTPWTLSSADVWTRTHRFGGRLTFVLGVALIGASLMARPEVQIGLIVGGAFALALATMGYSYLVWRRLGRPRD